MSSIYGHEALNMMPAPGTVFTTETLIAEIEANFGVNSHFHTYSAEGMTAHDLIAFLAERGRFHHCTRADVSALTPSDLLRHLSVCLT